MKVFRGGHSSGQGVIKHKARQEGLSGHNIHSIIGKFNVFLLPTRVQSKIVNN